MSVGPIALHGGGEFLPGDEPFLRAVLHRAALPAEARAASCLPASRDGRAPDARRIVVLPTAAGGERPELTVDHARDAFGRIADELDVEIRVTAAMVLDRESAADPRWAAAIAGADLVYLPGGDPGRIPAALRGSLAYQALLGARARGAVVAGASAGAMALAAWTWTPQGAAEGLGLTPGVVVVVPHAERFGDASPEAWHRWLGGVRSVPRHLGILALDERTGVLSGAPMRGGRWWEVTGPGRAAWLAPAADVPIVARDGERISLPG